MGIQLAQLKKILVGVNAVKILLGGICFILGCIYVTQFANELHDIIEYDKDGAVFVVATDYSIGVKYVVGVAFIIFGLAIIGISILELVGIWKHNLFVLKLVTGLVIISAIVLGLIAIGSLASKDNEEAIVNETDFFKNLNEHKEHMGYIFKKYDCCPQESCLNTYQQTCESAIFKSGDHYRIISAVLALIMAIVEIILAIFTIFLIKALNRARRPVEYMGRSANAQADKIFMPS